MDGVRWRQWVINPYYNPKNLSLTLANDLFRLMNLWTNETVPIIWTGILTALHGAKPFRQMYNSTIE